MKDIYFLSAWHRLYAEREGYPLETVQFDCEFGSVEYAFLRRPIEIHGEKYPYEDIVTPYAFSGPLLTPKSDSPETGKKLAEAFDAYFDAYCAEHGIVAEYVQFCPWLKNHEAFADFYTLDYRSNIVGIDLTKQDIMTEELDGRRRRAVRGAIKHGVEIVYDYAGERIDDFLRLYQFTVDKYDATDYYRFDRSFIRKMFDKLAGHVYFSCCLYQGVCVSICMILESEDYVHYHLAGHDPVMLFTNASSFLIYSVACKAQSEGKKCFILGGAEGKMLEFKQTFTRNCFFDYYSGKRIRQPEVYDMLTEKNGCKETPYFPAYRDNGTVTFMNWLNDTKE